MINDLSQPATLLENALNVLYSLLIYFYINVFPYDTCLLTATILLIKYSDKRQYIERNIIITLITLTCVSENPEVTRVEIIPTTTVVSSGGQCEALVVSQCAAYYNQTQMPNALGHSTQEDARQQMLLMVKAFTVIAVEKIEKLKLS